MRILALLLIAGLATVAPAAPPADTPQPSRKRDVGYDPTPQKRVKQMLDLAQVKPGDVVYDLGSGDGRIPITAVKDYGARGIGLEIDPKRMAEADANARAAGVTGKVEFRDQNIFTADISDATVVTLFLSPGLNRRLMPKLMQLKPGTRIVSYWHDMGDWPPEKKINGGLLGDNVYLWTIPAR